MLICWETSGVDAFGKPTTVTRCVIEGSNVEFDLEEEPGVTFDPNVGFDQSGEQCWYWISRNTNWEIIAINGDTATLSWDPDGSPGGPVVIDVTLPHCDSRPRLTASDDVEVWKVITEYVHQRPEFAVDPATGLGITGLDTFIAIEVPEPFDATLTSPGSGLTLEVHAEVSAVVIDWGDGTYQDAFTAVQHPFLTGYPDGIARHTYETMTCTEPGEGRCHPTLTAYPLWVSYQWTARWRSILQDEWNLLDVPPTETVLLYPVDEIVGVITDTK